MKHFLIFVMLFYLFLRSDGAGTSSVLSEEDDLALEMQLKMLNKPYVKSFKDEYGVIFDCVDMYKQPALDHPLLRNHTLQFALLLADSKEGSKFQAASAIIEVGAAVVPTGQRSSAQILLVDDSSSRVSVVQSGWLIAPDLEGDSQTRFMTYWTGDDYKTTGCFNMLCRGFVVLSQTATPGMVLPTGSGTAGISISKDGQTGNWQVFLNQEIVGYFPKEIINGMAGATEVQMGGITYAPPGQKSPPMGTGVAPVAGTITPASKFMLIGVQGANIAKNWVTKDVSDPDIYNIVMTSFTGPEGTAFQYGGPGGA